MLNWSGLWLAFCLLWSWFGTPVASTVFPPPVIILSPLSLSPLGPLFALFLFLLFLATYRVEFFLKSSLGIEFVD
jgi:hypothetical protein